MTINAIGTKAGGYEVSIDRVTSPGRATADGSVTVRVITGSARLALRLTPGDAARLATGLAAMAPK